MNEDYRDHYIDSSGLPFDQDNSDDLPIVREYGFQISQPADSTTQSSVETGSGHPGHPGHIFSGSSGSDPVYNLSGCDPDLDHVRNEIVRLTTWKLINAIA